MNKVKKFIINCSYYFDISFIPTYLILFITINLVLINIVPYGDFLLFSFIEFESRSF